MMPRHTAEQSTVKINKAEQLRADDAEAERPSAGRRGFGGFARPAEGSVSPSPSRRVEDEAEFRETVVAVEDRAELPLINAEGSRVTQHDGYDSEEIDGAYCPIDPQERLQCESCQ
jgi:ribonucleoside-diphosphate reductase alpha chain